MDAERKIEETPYPGLRSFDEGDFRLFFGREQEVAAILALLEQQQLVVVHGTSGCGKSSVVRAGVIPVFRLDSAANSMHAKVIVIRPSDKDGPLRALARELDKNFPLDVSAAPGTTAPTWSGLLSSSANWGQDISKAVSTSGSTLCVVIDQFEEIFALNRSGRSAEVRRIVDFLIGLSEPAPEGTALGKRALSVILTMRSDYLGHCALWDGFAETVNRCQYLLPKLSTLGALRAIHEPARRHNASVEPVVEEKLLAVLAREMDGLPILQHALMRSWRYVANRDGRTVVDENALNAAGGLVEALSRHAEEALKEATGGDSSLEEVAGYILRSLSDLDSDGRIIRRSVALLQLSSESGASLEIVKRIVDVFRSPSHCLFMPYRSEVLGETSIVTVSHEALLRQWRRLTDTGFDHDGRPKGLIYRELQDGRIWRSLSLQAQQYNRDRSSVLGFAATQQRLPWFRELEKRRGWIARYETYAVPDGSVELSAQDRDLHWEQTKEFIAASEKSLLEEQRKLDREKEMVKKLSSNQRIIVIMAAAIMILTVVYGLQKKEDADERASVAAAKIKDADEKIQDADEEIRNARNELYYLQVRTATDLAARYCVGHSAADKPSCLRAQSESYLNSILVGQYPAEPTDSNSPLPGGFGTSGKVEDAEARLFAIQLRGANSLAARHCLGVVGQAEQVCLRQQTERFLSLIRSGQHPVDSRDVYSPDPGEIGTLPTIQWGDSR